MQFSRIVAVILMLGVLVPATLQAAEVAEITIRIKHRIFISFEEVLVIEIGEEFQIADDEYSATVLQFVPDFAIKEDGTVVSRSEEPRNPAIEIDVLKDGEPEDHVWAFFGDGAPHYRRDSMIAFELVSFKWDDVVITERQPEEKDAE